MKLRHWLLAAALALSVSACGGDELSLEAQVAEAATKTSSVSSMRVAFDGQMRLPQVGPTSFEGTGVVDVKRKRVAMTMEMPPIQGQNLGEITVRAFDLDMYMKFDFLRRMVPQAKPWVAIDLEKAGRQMGFDLGALMQAGQTDPAQQLEWLRGSGQMEEVGEEDVRGVDTTHYRGVVDLEKAAEQFRGPRADAARRSVRQLVRLTGQKTIPMDVWIDDDSLVRRMRWTQTLPQGTAQTSMTMTMEVFDFGASVAIARPPARDVMTLEQLMTLGQQGRPAP